MTIEWLAGNRLRGTTAEKPVASLQSPSVGGWVEVGRTTFGSAGDDITVSSLTDKRYYMFLTSVLNSGDNSLFLQMGSGSVDTGSNYAHRYSNDGTADGAVGSQTKIFCGDNNTSPKFNVGYIANLSSKEKLYQGWEVMQNTAGAGTAPRRMESTGKWANTSNPLDTINFNNTMGGSYDTGSEMVVLGWDPADTHTTNFWEELYTDSGTSLDSGVAGIAAKKYLWIQTYIGTPTAGANHSFVFNGDTGSNYSVRYNIDGGSEGVDVSRADALVPHQGGASETGIFANTFIINNSANEKLIISHEVVEKTAGAGNAPSRYEHVAKWANTSAQITDIALSGTYGATSEMRVWGSD